MITLEKPHNRNCPPYVIILDEEKSSDSLFISLKFVCTKRSVIFQRSNEKKKKLYIYLEIKPFRVNIGASSFTSNKFNIFYTMCLKNKIFQKFRNFYLFLTLNFNFHSSSHFSHFLFSLLFCRHQGLYKTFWGTTKKCENKNLS